MSRRNHKHLSAFCAWVKKLTERWEAEGDGKVAVKPLYLEQTKAGNGWILWMQCVDKHAVPVLPPACKPVSVPSKFVVDRLAQNLFGVV